MNDWADHQDEIAEAIYDSMDMDWNSADGARSVVRYLNGIAPRTTAWLIEWHATRQSPVRYWHATEGHVIDPNNATWLARRKDAEAVIKRDGLFGGASPVEHLFGLLT